MDESIFLWVWRNVLLKCKGKIAFGVLIFYFILFSLSGFLQMGSCKGNSLHSHAKLVKFKY
jgi:hypothetical protein